MKKQLVIISLVAAVASFSALGQGYMTFGGGKNSVFNGSTSTSGLGAGGAAAFLWALVGTADPLGAGLSTSATSAPFGWSTLNSMTASGGWTWGVNNGTNGTAGQAIGTVNPSGLAVGGFVYNGAAPFQVVGTSAGTSYEIVAVAWNGAFGTSANLGWSSAFTYATGASASDPTGTVNFSGNGMVPFGVAPVPEPTTMALAALGGASLLLFRRKK